MADANIKKITIKNEDLPSLQFNKTKIAAKIVNVSGNGTTITYTTELPHDILPNTRVDISNITPTVYNLSKALVASVPSLTTFTIENNASGTYVSGGFVETYSVYDSENENYVIQEYIDNLYHVFRYRIASEDKNRYSHWSQIETLRMPAATTPFPYTSDIRITVSKAGDPEVVSAVWTKPSAAENPTTYEQKFNKINVFDVWVRWNETTNATATTAGWTPWELSATVSSNTFSILKSVPDYKTIDVAIQISTTDKTKDYHHNKLTLYKKTGAV
jgi:hypothetical protein